MNMQEMPHILVVDDDERLRRKIETDPKMPRYLHTVRGQGYVLRPD
jgi:CheY-like chemotaxis protein